jgi:microcystin degradation protein MlrC
VIPSIFASSISGGQVEMNVYERVQSKILEDIEKKKPHGILLAMHGAMVLTDDEDATGRLLKELRTAVGKDVKIGVTLDFHANITKRMVENADIIIGYHTYPHIDLYETGRNVANLVVMTLNGQISPKMSASKVPVILPAEACMTDKYPAVQIMDSLHSIEEKAISASVFLMQPWLNLKDIGCTSIVITNNEPAKADRLSKDLANKVWDLRREFKVDLFALEEAFIIAASKKTQQPIIFADSADSPSAGSPGDSNAIIKYIVENDIDMKVLINVVDAQTAHLAYKEGVGYTGKFSIGAKLDTKLFCPVNITAEVLFVGEHEFEFKGPMYTGKRFKMGITAVLKTKNTYIIVMENSVDNCDPELYRSLGFDLDDFDIVVVKSANGFRSPYEGLFEKSVIVETPGASSANLKSLPFDKQEQAVYPISDIDEFQASIYAVSNSSI